MKRLVVLASALLFMTVLLSFWYFNRRPQPVEIIPTLTGQPEYCLTCHADLPEISPSHPVATFGCVICHGGERLALEAGLAHSSMRNGRNPSELSTVDASCGGENCHGGTALAQRDHNQRVLNSLQATYAGAVANIRYTFGAQPDLTARQGVIPARDTSGRYPTGVSELVQFTPLQETNPSIQAFAGNCLYCHLTAQPLPGTEYAHLAGCAACHTPTAGTDLKQPLHRLTTALPYTQCNTCHNRGNYDLRLMQFQPRQDNPTDRLHDYYQPIALFTRCEYLLDCQDCHTRQEIMGDGHIYNNQKEYQYIRCKTCHGTLNEEPLVRTILDTNDIAIRMAFLNPVLELKAGDTIVMTEKGEPLWNLRRNLNGTIELFAKNSGIRYTVPLVKNSKCEQKSDEQNSRYCHACHAVQR